MKIEEEIKTKFESARHKAGVNIIYTSNWLDDKMNDVFKRFDVTSQQYNVLRILKGKYPDALCAGEIKAVMLDKNPDLTRLSDRLQAKGLIEREFNEANRRQVLIKITSKGMDLIKEIGPAVKQQSQTFNNLSDAEANLLSDLLDKLRG